MSAFLKRRPYRKVILHRANRRSVLLVFGKLVWTPTLVLELLLVPEQRLQLAKVLIFEQVGLKKYDSRFLRKPT
jgi:hypothetical protein